jgi:hypothetical protein
MHSVYYYNMYSKALRRRNKVPISNIDPLNIMLTCTINLFKVGFGGLALYTSINILCGIDEYLNNLNRSFKK